MTILNVSETGQSVEYGCDDCEKSMIGRLLPGNNGDIAAIKIQEIKNMYETLIKYSGDKYFNRKLDVSFYVDLPT